VDAPDAVEETGTLNFDVLAQLQRAALEIIQDNVVSRN
jgi:hypothetical protein